jgi:anti-sigma factor RsiW
LTCKEVRDLINAYVDGELDLVRNLEIEQHLQGCSACTQIYKNQQALKVALGTDSLYYRSPADLRQNIQSALRKSSKNEHTIRGALWPWAAIAAALLVLLISAWGISRLLSTPSANDALAQEVLSSHVRSLMASHLTDVASSDKHTVKPWFDGKLDFSPPVEDLTTQGFPLIGGRLDYLDGRPVAALVYGRNKHFINLFIWPSTTESAVTSEALQGYNIIHWSTAGMTYWAVSDVAAPDLQLFVQLVQQQVRGQ